MINFQARNTRAEAREFVAYLAAKALSQGDRDRATAIAKHLDFGPRVDRLCKAVALSSSVIDNPDYVIAARGFRSYLSNSGVFDRILAEGGFQIEPFRVTNFMQVEPFIADQRGEMQPITVPGLEVTRGNIVPRSAGVIIAVNSEFLAIIADDGMPMLGQKLGEGLTKATDKDFIEWLIDTDVVSIDGSGDFGASLQEGFDVFPRSGASSRMFLIVAPDVARSAAGAQSSNGPKYPEMTVAGGRVGQLSVGVSDELEAGGGLLIDANAIAANGGVVEGDVSGESTLQMSDTPSEGAQNQVSMFQVNAIAVKATRSYGFRRVREGAVVHISNMAPANT